MRDPDEARDTINDHVGAPPDVFTLHSVWGQCGEVSFKAVGLYISPQPGTDEHGPLTNIHVASDAGDLVTISLEPEQVQALVQLLQAE